jgi:hypothetical protein
VLAGAIKTAIFDRGPPTIAILPLAVCRKDPNGKESGNSYAGENNYG